ncbi:hypothetical protein ACUIJN_24920 [Metabacillus halosaccharovorans]|uniref:hypothetical protein n=1 Tax=Metabacillus halosaccharovorans TaxID=930124 RepID=UPI002040E1B1|nr:hypothetical protein [Metabacillus halosaccharovorans]MCM3444498.1 hypothetical protein [Metabacillus halosaccharovorans]
MKKILPVELPIVSGYKHHALPLSIISTEREGVNWIFNNYLQLYTHYSYFQDPHWLEFYLLQNVVDLPHNPFLNIQKAKRELLQDNLIDLFIKCIDANIYIYLWYDSFYFKKNKDRKHGINNLLIYGYDNNTQIFEVLDYDYNGTRKLSKIKVSFKLLLDSINNLALPQDWDAQIYFLSKKSNIESIFDLKLSYQLLEDYLNSYNTSNRLRMSINPKFPNDVRFGISVHNSLLEYITLYLDGKLSLTILPFHTYMEHKKCLVCIDKFVNQGNSLHLIEDLAKIEMKSTILRNIVLKYQISNNEELLVSALKIVEEIKCMEEQIIPNLLENIYTVINR